MSGLIVGLVWELPITKEFSSETKFVALAYADHAWQDGTHAYPSIDLVAEKTGYSERTVQRHVRMCENIGVLKLAGKGPHGTNSYSFPLEIRPDGAMRLAILLNRGDSVTPLAKTGGVTPVTPESVTPESVTPEPEVVIKSLTTTTGDASQKTLPEPEMPLLPVPVTPDPTTPKPNIFQLFENNICLLTPFLADYLKDAEATYPETWIIYAIEEAVKNNKRNWNYIDAILKRIKIEGFGGNHDSKLSAQKQSTEGKVRKANHHPGSQPANAASAAAAKRINDRRRARQPST